jgi:hypothetical protein
MSTMYDRQPGGVAPLGVRFDHETHRFSQLSRQTLRRQVLPSSVRSRQAPSQPERDPGVGNSADPERPTATWSFDTDIVFVVVGLVLAGIAWWMHSGDVEAAGILLAALAAYAAWLDGDNL